MATMNGNAPMMAAEAFFSYFKRCFGVRKSSSGYKALLDATLIQLRHNLHRIEVKNGETDLLERLVLQELEKMVG